MTSRPETISGSEVSGMCFVADASYYTPREDDRAAFIRRCAALNRINALACIMSAKHGWIGASYSVCEVLTTLYFGLGRRHIALSKGHAAAMQYACLYGLGCIDAKSLRSYKKGPKGLQAHTDRSTPGILVDTGSLGQTLSKIAGLAFVEPHQHYDVILGDGELQEGQVYEAFQTIVHYDLRQITVIVDENGYQSAQRVDEIKRIDSRRRMLEGFGFDVSCVDGHDPEHLLVVLAGESEKPRAILARTTKAGGSRALGEAGSPAIWHSRVPDPTLAQEVIDEQVELVGLSGLSEEWENHRHTLRQRSASSPESRDDKEGSTGRHFARCLSTIAKQDQRVVVLDADLAQPCGVADLADTLGRERFVELGISEQDMISFAGGVALSGRVPVINTYASFYKRGFEQLCVNASEMGRSDARKGAIIYAGHYAGLGYYTDGKSHQSLNDLGFMRTVPGLVVMDPVDERQTRGLLSWVLGRSTGQFYFRLRRIGAGLDDHPKLSAAYAFEGASRPEWWISHPLVLDNRRPLRNCFVTCGPFATRLALDALEHDSLGDWSVVVVSVLGHPQEIDWLQELLDKVERVVTVEDGNRQGGLWSWFNELQQTLGLSALSVRSLSVEGFGASFRSFDECRRGHDFLPERAVRIAIDDGLW